MGYKVGLTATDHANLGAAGRNELFLNREVIVARIKALPGCADVKSLNLRAG